MVPVPEVVILSTVPETLAPRTMLPPEAVIVSVVPETLPPITMPPLDPVDSRAKVPEAVIVPEVVNAPAPPAESVNDMLAPVELPLPVVAVLSTKVTLPVVLAVQLGVAMLREPIAPLPLVNAADVEPVTVPAV